MAAFTPPELEQIHVVLRTLCLAGERDDNIDLPNLSTRVRTKAQDGGRNDGAEAAMTRRHEQINVTLRTQIAPNLM